MQLHFSRCYERWTRFSLPYLAFFFLFFVSLFFSFIIVLLLRTDECGMLLTVAWWALYSSTGLGGLVTAGLLIVKRKSNPCRVGYRWLDEPMI